MAFKPPCWPTVAIRIFHRDVEGLVAFLKAVFDANDEYRMGAPAEMWIGDSLLMISDGAGLREAFPACLYVYVPDVDQTFARATGRGAHCIEAPAATPYSDRRAIVEDAWGNVWQIATREK